MKTLSLVSFLLIGPTILVAQAKDQLTLLKERCAEQERQIRALELKVEQLQKTSFETTSSSSAITQTSNSLQNTKKSATKDPQLSTYTIKSGDTFYRIARNHQISLAQLKALNPKTNPSRLKVGQKIKVAGSSVAAVSGSILNNEIPDLNADTPSAHENLSLTENTPELRIVMTDRIMTFREFAESYQTSTGDLNSLNGLNLREDTPLAIGSELYVPGS